MLIKVFILFFTSLFIFETYAINQDLGIGCYWEPKSDYGNNDIQVATYRYKNEDYVCCCKRNYSYNGIKRCEYINTLCNKYNNKYDKCYICTNKCYFYYKQKN